MPRFRKRALVIEAEQFDSHTRPLPFATRNIVQFDPEAPAPGYFIRTLEGPVLIHDGDWIIRGVKGEFYPCNPDIFRETYELVIESGAI